MVMMSRSLKLLVGIGMLDSRGYLQDGADAEVVRQCRRVVVSTRRPPRHRRVGADRSGGHSAPRRRLFLRRHQLWRAGARTRWRETGVPEVERATKLVDAILATHEVAPLPTAPKSACGPPWRRRPPSSAS
jgi:hypothetical protein